MAPLPHNNTNIFYVDYSGNMGTRTMQFRCNDGILPSEASLRISDFIDEYVAPNWYNDVTTVGARWQSVNTDFSLPVGFTNRTGALGGAQPPINYSEFVSVVGRGGTLGRRVRLTIYGLLVPDQADHRLEPGSTPLGDGLIDGLNLLIAQGCFRTIGNEAPILQTYVNWAWNAYHQRKARTSG